MPAACRRSSSSLGAGPLRCWIDRQRHFPGALFRRKKGKNEFRLLNDVFVGTAVSYETNNLDAFFEAPCQNTQDGRVGVRACMATMTTKRTRGGTRITTDDHGPRGVAQRENDPDTGRGFRSVMNCRNRSDTAKLIQILPQHHTPVHSSTFNGV